ncbi:MAG: branched-chain amino acid ABC transporter permease [Bacillota bacterium]
MLILNAVINGLLFGGVLALMAFGMNLMFGVVQIVHLAYGQFIMVGLYLVYLLTVLYHVPLLLSCALATIAIALLSVLCYYSVVKPLLKAPPINQLLALAGLWIVLENACLAFFGATYKGVQVVLPVLHVGEVYIAASNLIGFGVGLITLGLLYLFLNKTYTGVAIRAVAQDAEVSGIMGINSRTIYLITFVVGGALAGITAACFVPVYAVHPHFGSAFTLLAFIIVILGGMGNLIGGFIGAFIIGVVTSVSSTLLNPEIGQIIALLICLLIIILRPQGLLGVRART